MYKHKESNRVECLHTFGCWDSEGNSFDIHVTRDIIKIMSTTKDFSFLLNLLLRVEFQKCQGLYAGIVIDGNIYYANHKDLFELKQLISARVAFLSIQNEYYFTKKIGQGGQAEGVYEAYQIESEEVRAIKKYDKSKLSVKAIHKEILMTQKFSQKNVVKIFEVYESNSSIYAVYERLKVFQSDKHSFQQKQNFIFDLLDVVQLMHSKQYMHRDIKMANIMIGDDDEIRLVDFGLATKCKKQHKQCGTPGYMAPEIFKTREYNENGIFIVSEQSFTKCMTQYIFFRLTNDQLYIGIHKNDIKNKNQFVSYNTEKLNKIPQEFQEITKCMLVTDPSLRISARIAKNMNTFKKDFDNSVLTDDTMNNSQKFQYK